MNGDELITQAPLVGLVLALALLSSRRDLDDAHIRTVRAATAYL